MATARLSPRLAIVFGLVVLAFGGTVDNSAPAQGADRALDSAHVTLVTRFALNGVADVASGADGLYVLRQAAFPGDPSDAGWELDLLNPTTGRIIGTATGDAAPVSLIVAFGSVWVSTGSGAKPGGLGPGIDRLDATTLTHQDRLNIAPLMAIAATSSTLWILEGGDKPQLEALDPATDAITHTKKFVANDLVEALTATTDRVIVGYEPFGSPPRNAARTNVMWIDPSSLKTLSNIVVARTSSAAGAAEDTYSLAATSDSTLYVGLESARTGSSLVVLRKDHVVGPRRAVGNLVTASPDGTVWASAIYRHKKSADTSDLVRIATNGTVTSQLNGLPDLVSISGVGHVLYAGTSSGVLLFRG